MRNFNRNGGSRGGRRSDFGRNDRQMFSVVCSNCGKDCKVPFKPTGEKPVYCSDCFEKIGNRDNRRSFGKPKFGERKQQYDQYKTQFETLNVKLDKILSFLNPKQISGSFTPVKMVVEASKVEKPPKKKSPEEKE